MKIISPNRRPEWGSTLFVPLIAGMVTAQLIATVFVHFSNQKILALVSAAEEAGYFPIPTGPAANVLDSFGAVLWGGLFFTLSIGVGLTLLTWAGVQLWHLLFRRSRSILVCYGVIWAGLMVAVNGRGFTLFPSLFCLLVPLATAYAAVRTMPDIPAGRSYFWIIPVLVLALLTGMWATRMDRNLFVTIRDHILLSNPVGRRVNDFYYRYTLYPAEAFKSFGQKTLRSCNLRQEVGDDTTRNWQERLADHDVLVLQQISRPDIRMIFSKMRLRLTGPNGDGIDTTADELWGQPARTLSSFSRATDRYAPLRRMTLAGLLLGFPILLFVVVYGILHSMAGLRLNRRQATWTASGICLAIGILLFLPMLKAGTAAITPGNVGGALAADDWTQRVAALRYIEQHNLEIAAYPRYLQQPASPLVVERYWLARAMAKSRASSTYVRLLAMIDDPHPNVMCQAFFALGERGNRAAIAPIKRRLPELDHWYAQWYGYRALRKLGWRQTKSN